MRLNYSAGERRRCRLAFAFALGLFAWTLGVTSVARSGEYTLFGAYSGAENGALDLSMVRPMNRWQEKRVGILNLYGSSGASVAAMEEAWTHHGAVPMLSFHPPYSSSAVARGDFDNSIFAPLIAQVKAFLAGPDGSLDTPDDRRAYLRYAWEANFENYPYSPCNQRYGESPDSFRRAWRHVHSLFSAAGIGRTRLAWVFSVLNGDSCSKGAPEKLYPGGRFVDWLGIDAYASCGNLDVRALLDPMRIRLEAIDRSKPIGVNEFGVSSFEGVSAKNRVIADYWGYLRFGGLRMSLWFNTDKGMSMSCAQFEKPWAAFGTTHGDSDYVYCADSSCVDRQEYRGFSAYRRGVRRDWVRGSSNKLPRYLSTRRFLGR